MKKIIAKFTLIALLVAFTSCSSAVDVNTKAETLYKVVSSRILIENPGGMPAMCRAANGDLLLAYATMWEGYPAGGVIKLMRSTDEGKTWSHPRTIVWPKTVVWSTQTWSGLHLMPDDSLILSFTHIYTPRRQNVPIDEARPQKIWKDSGAILLPHVVRSTDHGRTWSKAVRVAPKIKRCYAMGRPLTAKNGDVLVPLIPFLPVDVHAYPASGFVRTSDNGKTWGPLEIIAGGPDAYSEVTLGLAKNGDIVAVLRDRESGPYRLFWQTVSHDNGRTWQKPWKTNIIGKMPDMLTLPSGRLLMAVGSVDCFDGGDIWKGQPGSSYAALFYSDDNAATWNKDAILVSPDPLNLVPFDAPELAHLKNGDILVLTCASDRKFKDHPLSGWTLGQHFVLNVIRRNR